MICEVCGTEIRDGDGYCQACGFKVKTPPRSTSDQTMADQDLEKKIRSWGFWLIAIGIFSIFSAGFANSSWGLLLIFVGTASFFFRHESILVVHGVLVIWAGISNISSGEGSWMVFSVIQAIFAVQIFKQFFDFQKTQAHFFSQNPEYPIDKAAQRVPTLFPISSLLIGITSAACFIGIIVIVFLYIGFTSAVQVPTILIFGEGIVVSFAILGFGLGLASLLSKFKRKAFSILGMIFSGLVLLTELGLALLG